MEKKEKIFILIVTFIILIGVFIAFIVSNSQKTPPEVLVQNADRKSVSAIMGGYNWKVFGTDNVTDAIDLEKVDYSTNNTIVSKTDEDLTVSASENFTVQYVKYIKNVSNESFDVSYKLSETGTSFSITTPEIEGTYICVFKLNFYSKGSAEYGVKVVVTDENIYEINDIISYKNTKITDISKIKEILQKLPYSKQLSSIMIDKLSDDITLIVKYSSLSATRGDLFNNTVALFALIPDLEAVVYELDKTNNLEDIYYSRNEVNNLISRDVLEYASNVELWTKEIVYKEEVKSNNEIVMYNSAISSVLSQISEKDLGDYIAIDITNPSGDISLDEYDAKKLLRELSNEYDVVLNIDSNEFENTNGTLVKITVTKYEENSYKVDCALNCYSGKIIEKSYKAIIDNNVATLQDFEGLNSLPSGE